MHKGKFLALALAATALTPLAANASNTVWNGTVGGGSSVTITRPSGSMAAGACMLLAISADNGATLTVNDGESNSYTQYVGSDSATWELATGVAAGSSSITVNDTNSTNIYAVYGVEIPSPCALDVDATGSSSSANPSAPSVTTTYNGDLVFGEISSDSVSGSPSITPGSGYTGVMALNSAGAVAGAYSTGTYHYVVELEYKTQTSAGAIAPNFTSTGTAWGLGTLAINTTPPIPQCGSSVTPAISSGYYELQCQLNGNLTVNNPTGAGASKDQMHFQLESDGAGHTVTFGSAYLLPGAINTLTEGTAGQLSNTAGEVDDVWGFGAPAFPTGSGEVIHLGLPNANMGN